jgi:PKD repeat protein
VSFTKTASHSFSAGSHTVTLTVTRTLDQISVQKNITITFNSSGGGGNGGGGNGGSCPTMSGNNVAIAYNGMSSNCSSNTAQPCNNGETIQFDATSYAGYDFNCSNHSFTWDFGDGGSATTKSPTHSFSTSGPHVVKVTISNATQQNFQRQITMNTGTVGACGTITSLSLFIDYHNANSTCGPLTSAQCSSGEPISFTVSQFGTYDMNCATHSFDWDFGDGSPHGSGKDVVHQYQTAGTYPAKCVVNNGSQQITLQQAVNVGGSSGGGADVQVVVTTTPMPGISNGYTFAPSVTGAPATAVYVWDFGDGTTQTRTNASAFVYVYAAKGKYTVTVRVYSNASQTQLLKSQTFSVGGSPKRRGVRH